MIVYTDDELNDIIDEIEMLINSKGMSYQDENYVRFEISKME